MLAYTCQGGGKVRIIAPQFANCEINQLFAKWNCAKTVKMRSKVVEDKKTGKFYVTFQIFGIFFFKSFIKYFQLWEVRLSREF